jgi:hypothetical protein
MPQGPINLSRNSWFCEDGAHTRINRLSRRNCDGFRAEKFRPNPGGGGVFGLTDRGGRVPRYGVQIESYSTILN